LPWRLKSDLKHFRALTMGRPVLMGRKTFASIGRPLPGRTNIVVSRDPSFAAPGAVVATRIEDALTAATGDALRRNVNEIMVVGGAHIYAALMARADRLEITRVHARPDGDAEFPDIDPALWRETERTECPAGPEDEAAFTLTTFRRV
jgi:dihydrofolate reductase